jgi:hypothetical protein
MPTVDDNRRQENLLLIILILRFDKLEKKCDTFKICSFNVMRMTLRSTVYRLTYLCSWLLSNELYWSMVFVIMDP